MSLRSIGLAAVLFSSILFAAIAQQSETPPAAPTMAAVLAASKASDWRPLDPENTMYMELPGGRVVIELAPAFAPLHVQNIKTLVREGYFDGLSVIRSQDNYVAQWGDPEDEDEAKARSLGSAKKTLPSELTVPIGKYTPFTRLPDVDGYAPQVGFADSLPAARDPKTNSTWLCHCYGMVGIGRGNDVEGGIGNSLYAVTGHAPRHLDRNVILVGRVMQGIELLSTLPRGTGNLGFYEKAEERVSIKAVRMAIDVPEAERTPLEVLRSGTETFTQLVESRRNRREEWFKHATGHVDLCNVPVVVRKKN